MSYQLETNLQNRRDQRDAIDQALASKFSVQPDNTRRSYKAKQKDWAVSSLDSITTSLYVRVT